MPALDAALAYRARGWSPLPLLPGLKRPALEEWKPLQERPLSEDALRKYFSGNPNANVGVVTGSRYGLAVVDVDGDKGRQSVSGLQLPMTRTVLTPHGSHHYFSVAAERDVPCAVLLPGVDFKATGGYVVAPPSVQESGQGYELYADAPLAPLPGWVEEILWAKAGPELMPKLSADRLLETGTRNTQLFKAACGFMRGRCSWCNGQQCVAADHGHLFKRIMALNKKAAEPLAQNEVWQIAKNAFTIARRAKAPNSKPQQ